MRGLKPGSGSGRTAAFRAKITSRLRLVAEAYRARRASGVGIWRQLLEVVRLRLGPTRLSAREYYDYRLWDNTLYPGDKSGFGGGWLTKHLHRRLNNKAWEVLMTDKLASASVFETSGVPYPGLCATVTTGRRFGDAPNLRTADELAAFLRGPCPYPLFLKPIKGSSGRSCYAIDGYEPGTDRLRLRDGSAVGLPAFLETLADPTGFGFVLLRCLESHPAIRAVTGSTAVASCRVVVLLGDDGPRIFRVVLKLPTGRNMTDNFRDGRSGNVIAHVDATGVVARAVRGFGFGLTLVERHPDTGQAVVGMRVPDWEALVALVERAAPLFPGARWQSWDIGLGANGPELLELNSSGDVVLLCLARGSGCYDAQLVDFLARHRAPDDAPRPLFPRPGP